MPINQDQPPEPRRPRLPRLPRWLLIASIACAVTGVVLGVLAGWVVNRDLPDIRSLEDYQPPSITQILSSDGRIVHQFAEQKRIVVPLSRIGQSLQKAVIAVEDSNFNEHVGVDPLAIVRAVIRDIRLRRWEEGGSTLTQQLTKILFLNPQKTLRRKIQEAMLAVQIEKTYTKDEILEFYLNQIYMGHGRYGMEAAAQYYFGVHASDVTLDQAALLAGVIQIPERYSPMKNPERSRQRRNKVLDRMLAEGFIDAEVAERAKEAPVVVAKQASEEAIAPYFSEEIRKQLAPRYGDEALLRDGMVIRTGLDLDLQLAANTALSKGLRALDKRRGFRRPARRVDPEKTGGFDAYRHPGWDRPVQAGDLVTGLVTDVSSKQATVRVGRRIATLQQGDAEWTGRKDLTDLLRPGDLTLFEVRTVEDSTLELTLDQEPEVEGAVVALDPRTGDIKAMAGGFDFARSQFNRATQALRQCGSAFKPFIYAAAIEAGHSPSDLLFDEPTVFVDPAGGPPYQPENYERMYHGVVTLRRALEESINIPTVSLLNEIGYAHTVDFARRLGISSRLYPYPSLALGASEVTLMELTAAYGVFPTGGILSTPRYYADIRDRTGQVLEEAKSQNAEVLRAEVAAVMVSMMQGVVQHGTAASAGALGTSIAGKTGTTDDYTDAWFIGYSPSLVLGVWVGHDTKISLGSGETGARAALPIWTDVMGAYLASHPGEEFAVSPDTVTLPVDRETGLRVAPELGCRRVIMETFIKGTEIERPCTENAHFRVGLPYFLQRFPIMSGSRPEIGDEDLDRLLRENPFHLELLGRASLNVLTDSGVRLVRLARDEGDDLTWSFFRRRDDRSGPSEEDLHFVQLLPGDLPPIDADPHPHLGLDGRAAAVSQIRYP